MVKENSSQLKKVRKIEQKRIPKIPVESRPVYHLSSPAGWMNDPNGFSVYQNEYHLFFQYHPFSNTWGPMHWGHCKSNDFIRWEYLPTAMAPDENYDAGGCYGKKAEATKLMSLMGLGVKCGDAVDVEISGADEDNAYEEIKAFFESNL